MDRFLTNSKHFAHSTVLNTTPLSKFLTKFYYEYTIPSLDISNHPIHDIFNFYRTFVCQLSNRIDQNPDKYLYPFSSELLRVRRLQDTPYSKNHLLIFKRTMEALRSLPLAHFTKKYNMPCEDIVERLTTHYLTFAPTLTLLNAKTDFTPPNPHKLIQMQINSVQIKSIQDALLTQSPTFCDAVKNKLRDQIPFLLNAEAEVELNINTLKLELKKFLSNDKNCLPYQLQVLFNSPPDIFNQGLSTIMSTAAGKQKLPDLMRIISQLSPSRGKPAKRVHELYSSLYDMNTFRRVKHNRQKLRDHKLNAEGLFSIDLKLPACVNDVFGRLSALDDNGTFTALLETINRFETGFNEVTKPLQNSPEKREIVVRVFIALLLFIIVCYSCTETSAKTFAALFLLNSLPHELLSYFSETIFNFTKMFTAKLIHPIDTIKEIDRQYLEAHGIRFDSNGEIITTSPRDEFEHIPHRTYLSNGLDYESHRIAYNFDSQSENPPENLIDCFSKYLLTLFKNKEINDIKVEDIRVKRITNIARIISSSKTIIEFVDKVFTAIKENISEYLFGEPNFNVAYERIDKRIPEWITEVEKLDFALTSEGKIYSPIMDLSKFEQKIRLITLLREGESIFKQVSSMYVKPEKIVRFIELKLNRIKDLVKSISATLVGMKSKHEPFTLYIWGNSGIGKSLMVDFLTQDMYVANGEKFDFVRDKFMKNENTQFWDGYDHQKVYVIDDIFQVLDAQLRTQQIMDFMNIGSRCPFPLNMADCASKGTVSFSSETFIVTANNLFAPNEVDKLITTNDAYQRRIKAYIHASLKPEYTDSNKRFDALHGTDEVFVRDAYIFDVQLSDKQLQNLSWNDLIFLLADERRIHVARQRELDLALENSNKTIRNAYLQYRLEKFGEQIPDEVEPEPEPIQKPKFSPAEFLKACPMKVNEVMTTIQSYIPETFDVRTNMDARTAYYNTPAGKKRAARYDKYLEETRLRLIEENKLHAKQSENYEINQFKLLSPEFQKQYNEEREVRGLSPLSNFDLDSEALLNFNPFYIFKPFLPDFVQSLIPEANTFAFNINPHIHILQQTPADKITNTRNRWAADLTTVPSHTFAPTKVRQGHDYHFTDLFTEDEFKRQILFTKSCFPYQLGENEECYNNDIIRLTLFRTCMMTHKRIHFALPRFRSAYESARYSARSDDARFNTEQHMAIEAEREDLTALRMWLCNERSTIDVATLQTVFGQDLYRCILTDLAKLNDHPRIDAELAVYRSTIRHYLTHPVTIALGLVSAIFTGYHLYKYFKDKTDLIPSQKESPWKAMTSEACATASGDQITKRARRIKFKNRTKLSGESNTTMPMEPHPHQCSACQRYYAHTHKHNPLKSHTEYKFSCPYEDCTQYWKKFYLRPPNNVYAISEEEIEHCDPPLVLPDLGAEAEKDPQCMVTLQIIGDHICTITVTGLGKVRGLIVKGRTVMMPYHTFFLSDNISESNLTVEGRLIPTVNFKLGTNFVIDKEHDLLFFNLPDTIPLKRDIIHHFTDVSAYIDTINDAYLIKNVEKNCNLIQHIYDLQMAKQIDYHVPHKSHPLDERWYVPNGYHYSADTAPGDCGSPIVACHTGIAHKILGIHIAGDKGKGALMLVTPSLIKSNISKLFVLMSEMERESPDPDYVEDFFDCEEFPIHANDEIQILGLIPENKIPFQPSATAIRASPLHCEVFPVVTAPALLRKTDKLNPLRNDLIKQCTKEVLFNEEYLDLAVTDLSNVINALKSPYKNRKLLSMHENVNGIDGDDYICSINFQSSVGYPWFQKFRQLGSKKDKYFPGEIGNKTPIEPIVEAVRIMDEKINMNIVPFYFFHDSLKDERRPLEKVSLGKTRIFSVPPVEVTLLVRKYYLNFVAHLMYNHILSEVSVGLNVHSDQWGMFYKHAAQIGHNWIAGDYGGYDKRLPYQVCMAAVKVVNNFYNDEFSQARLVLGESMFSSVHIADRVVYQTHHGMPSGVPITAVFNSVVNSLLFRIAFIELSVANGNSLSETLLMLREGIAIRTYGDDHIVRVHEKYDFFNMVSVSNFFSKQGLEYTTTTKKNVVDLYVQDDELSYLKRKFVERRGILYAPLEMDSIREMINWIRKTDDPVLAILQNIDAALLEMTHYPENEWNKFYNDIRKACREKAIIVPTLNFKTALQIIRSGDTSNLSVIFPETQTLQCEGTAAYLSEPSRTYLGPTNAGNGSLNKGCRVLLPGGNCSRRIQQVAQKLIKKTFNFNSQCHFNSAENMLFKYLGAISDTPIYEFSMTESQSMPSSLRYMYHSENNQATFYVLRETKMNDFEMIDYTRRIKPNLQFQTLEFKIECEDSALFSLSKSQYAPPAQSDIFFRHEATQSRNNRFLMFTLPPRFMNKSFAESANSTHTDFLFNAAYEVDNHRVYYLDKSHYPALQVNESILFDYMFKHNDTIFYTYIVSDVLHSRAILNNCTLNFGNYESDKWEKKLCKSLNVSTPFPNIIMTYVAMEKSRPVVCGNLLEIMPPDPRFKVLFEYDSETPDRLYYRLNFRYTGSSLPTYFAAQSNSQFELDEESNNLFKHELERQNAVNENNDIEETQGVEHHFGQNNALDSLRNADYTEIDKIANETFDLNAQSQQNAELDEIVTERQQITQFLDASNKEETNVHERQKMLKSLNPYPKATFESFWCRPYPVYSGTWKTAQNGCIAALSFPNLLFNIDSLWDKIKNFRYCNFDIELSIRVNGTPFHYGQLMFSVYPNGSNGLLMQHDGSNNKYSPYENTYSASGFPHVLISPTENQIQKLRIPYVLPMPFIDLYTLCSDKQVLRELYDRQTEIANVLVYVTAPLNGSGVPTPVTYTVFARIINPDFTGYMQETELKSYSAYASTRKLFKGSDATARVFLDMETANTIGTYVPETGFELNAESESIAKSNNNSQADTFAETVNAAASLAVNTLSKVVADMCMPNDTSLVQPVQIKLPNLSNTRGVDFGYTLSSHEESAVKSAKLLFGDAQDQMKISKIVSRPGLIGQFLIKQSSKAGERLAYIPVTPFMCHVKRMDRAALAHYYHTPISFVSTAFTFWRGDINYRFDFICSNFHNTRVRIGWIPKYDSNTDVGIIEDSNYMNKVIDLNTQTSVEFNVPYLREKPYLLCSPQEWNGVLFVSIINPISYPEATIPDIYCNVWINGQPNLNFAFPTHISNRRGLKVESNCNGWIVTHTSGSANATTFEEEFPQEAYTSSRDIKKQKKVYDLNAQSDDSQVLPGRIPDYDGFMFGENIQSVKELIMKPALNSLLTTTVSGIKSKILTIAPFNMDKREGTVLYDACASDVDGHYGHFAQLFRYVRGSFRFKIFIEGWQDYTVTASAGVVSASDTYLTWGSKWYAENTKMRPLAAFSGTNICRLNNSINMVPSFHLPYTSPWPFVPTSTEYQGQTAYVPELPCISFDFTDYAGNITDKTIKFMLYSNPGDDFEMAYQIGPPAQTLDKYEVVSKMPLNIYTYYDNFNWSLK